MHHLAFVSPAAADRRWRAFLPQILLALLAVSLVAPAPANLAAQASTADMARPDLTEAQQVFHVLNRLGFGPRPGDIDRVMAMGIQAYIEQQLYPDAIPDPVAERKMAGYTTLHLTIEEGVQAFLPVGSRGIRRRESAQRKAEMAERSAEAGPIPRLAVHPGSASLRRRLLNPQASGIAPSLEKPQQYELYQSRLIRAVHSKRQLQEMLVDFWMNHFNIQFDFGDPYLVSDFEERVIRPRVLGNFEDLLVATATSPSMMRYLDNWVSSAPEEVVQQRLEAGHPVYPTGKDGRRALALRRRQPFFDQAKGLNENYGRELMELHTLGVDGGYTQEDVVQVSRALTGWTLTGTRDDGTDGSFVFDPLLHIEGDKVVLGQTIKSGGMGEGRQILTLLAHHPSTAHFISTKLVRRFVADEPPADIVAAAAATFQQTGGDIREVLRTIFTHPEFFSPSYYEAKIKKPIEIVASGLRAVNGELDFPGRNDNIQIAQNQIVNNFSNRMEQFLIVMGEPIYGHEDPDGFPDIASAWISTSSVYRRMEFAIALTSGKVPNVTIDLDAAHSLFQQLGFPEATPDQIAQVRAIAANAGKAEGDGMDQQMMVEGMMGGAGAGDEAKNELDDRVIAAAFVLGSPRFQKR